MPTPSAACIRSTRASPCVTRVELDGIIVAEVAYGVGGAGVVAANEMLGPEAIAGAGA